MQNQSYINMYEKLKESFQSDNNSELIHEIKYVLTYLYNIYLSEEITEELKFSNDKLLTNDILERINYQVILNNVYWYVINKKVFRDLNMEIYYNIYDNLLKLLPYNSFEEWSTLVSNAMVYFFENENFYHYKDNKYFTKYEVVDVYQLMYKEPQDIWELYWLFFTSIDDIKLLKQDLLNNIDQFEDIYKFKTLKNKENRELVDMWLFDYNKIKLTHNKNELKKFLETI